MRFGRNPINDALDRLGRVEKEPTEHLEMKFFRGFNFASSAVLECLPERNVLGSLEEAQIDLDRAIRAELRL
jgi:hypothetical protein